VAAIDIRHAGIDYVGTNDSHYVIGGSALLRDAERLLGNTATGMLRDAIRNTAPWLIRNSATLAGNIANASPAADSIPALLAVDARVLVNDGKESTVSVDEILTGPHRTTLGTRLIVEIRISKESSRRGAFIKLARSKSDIALVNVAVSFVPDGDRAREVRIALGAVAPTAIRARRAEALLEEEVMTGERLREVERVVAEEVQPISDWRASAAYRRRMSGVLVRRALQRAAIIADDGERV
jgi:carbon-monoxide dehydrogenase medium subunit